MSPSFDALVHQVKAIHIFRHLLRESGYLPDHVARREVKRQIISRFRNNLPTRLELLQTAKLQNAITTTSIEQRDVAVVTLQRRMKAG
jgi:hypothetical protein